MDPLVAGAPAPWFKCRSTSNPVYNFDTVAGHVVVLTFFGSAGDADSMKVLTDVMKGRQVFDDEKVLFFGVSTDPDDERLPRVRASMPGIRFFWDFERKVSVLYGAARGEHEYTKVTYVLDRALRILAVIPFGDRPGEHFELVSKVLQS